MRKLTALLALVYALVGCSAAIAAPSPWSSEPGNRGRPGFGAVSAPRDGQMAPAAIALEPSGGPQTPVILGPSGRPQTPMAEDQRILHVLSRFTYGSRPGDLERIRGIRLVTYIEHQLAPERLDDSAAEAALRRFPTLALSVADLLAQFPRPDPGIREKIERGELSRREAMELYPPDKRPARITEELQAAKMVRALLSERQLEEVLVDFWFNYFNVDARKGATRWYITSYERDAIRPHALGRFGDLVRATARHPAMLFYLDNWVSVRPDFQLPGGPGKGRRSGLNENYARELMELHTLGVDGGYTQHDVTEVARCFSGWTIERPRQAGRFAFRAAAHDDGEKTVLGHRITAGGGERDGERVIDILIRHPSTARFVATKLTRRFVADEPDPALVDRVARTYRETDGDIRAMLRTIIGSPEFFSAAAYRAKIKKPTELVVSAVRALSASVHDAPAAGRALAQAAARIGEPLYQAQPPTGHPDIAEAWVNAGALLARMNFALGLAQNRLPGVRIDVAAALGNVPLGNPAAVLERVLERVLDGQVSPETRATLRRQLDDPEIRRATADDRIVSTDVEKLLALVLGSPEFQRR
jgi:uncharacterized protein (DUF1800 family)